MFISSHPGVSRFKARDEPGRHGCQAGVVKERGRWNGTGWVHRNERIGNGFFIICTNVAICSIRLIIICFSWFSS